MVKKEKDGLGGQSWVRKRKPVFQRLEGITRESLLSLRSRKPSRPREAGAAPRAKAEPSRGSSSRRGSRRPRQRRARAGAGRHALSVHTGSSLGLTHPGWNHPPPRPRDQAVPTAPAQWQPHDGSMSPAGSLADTPSRDRLGANGHCLEMKD